MLAKGLQFEHSAILRLLTILEKKVFKTLAVLQSPVIISSLSINAILFVNLTLSDKKGLKVAFATFLLVCVVCLQEITCGTRKYVFYFTSKALFFLEIIKF